MAHEDAMCGSVPQQVVHDIYSDEDTRITFDEVQPLLEDSGLLASVESSESNGIMLDFEDAAVAFSLSRLQVCQQHIIPALGLYHACVHRDVHRIPAICELKLELCQVAAILSHADHSVVARCGDYGAMDSTIASVLYVQHVPTP